MKQSKSLSWGRFTEEIDPYFWGGIFTFLLRKLNINYISSNSMGNAIEGIITVASIIIGFIGAILPVILSMKNESKFVHYVFERDKDRLFFKYVKATINLGVFLILVSIILCFRTEYEEVTICKNLFYLWIFLIISFLRATSRSVNNMLKMLFQTDQEMKQVVTIPEKSDQEKEFEEKHKKNG